MDWKFNVGDLVIQRAKLQEILDINEVCTQKADFRFVQVTRYCRIIGREMDECASGCSQKWYVGERENGDRIRLHEDSWISREEAKPIFERGFNGVFEAYKASKAKWNEK